MPTHDEYTSSVLDLASDTTYANQGDAFDGTLIKPATPPMLALLKQGARPARQMAAQVRNWVDREIVKILGALVSDATYLSSAIDPTTNGTRLSLSPTRSVPTADVVGGSTLYLLPHSSSLIWLYDSASSLWVPRTLTSASVALSGLTAGKNYDVFAYWTGSAVALSVLSIPWTDDATPNPTPYFGGVKVRALDSSSLPYRYVGSFRATGATTTEDSASKRYVCNESNRVERHLLAVDTTDNWQYGAVTYRQARNTAANKVEALVTRPTPFTASVAAQFAAASATAGLLVAVGLDSTTAALAACRSTYPAAAAGSYLVSTSVVDDMMPAGFHALTWLERISSATATTIYGNSAGGNQSHLRARLAM